MELTEERASLSAIDELAKVYASSYASPHHITFTVEGLRNLIAAIPSLPEGWVAVDQKRPPKDEQVLVYRPDGKFGHFAIDEWGDLHEAPVSWSSATICVGEGWGDHEYEEISHWKPLTSPLAALPLPPPPSAAKESVEVVPVYERRLREVLAVVSQYLPPDGMPADEALSKIIGLVDPWPQGEK